MARLLEALQAAGHLRRLPGRARSIELLGARYAHEVRALAEGIVAHWLEAFPEDEPKRPRLMQIVTEQLR